jgi:ADP-ribosylglycohydrolase
LTTGEADLSGRDRALLSLTGLSVGDALGERFFGPPDQVIPRIQGRVLPEGPWRYTDDTQMALSIVDLLLEEDGIDPSRLARAFAERYDLSRGYGGGAHQLLQAIRLGAAWQDAAPALFNGSGSFGNGAAMRVAPLGGYFSKDLDSVVEHATLSAVVTHAHPEGVAGAVAVAVAAAAAWQQGVAGDLDPELFFSTVLSRTPAGETREGIQQAAQIPASSRVDQVAESLGSGQRISAQDTVPFVIWCAAHHLHSFEEAFWTTVYGLGDRDTTCAMVGGIVALSSRQVPEAWIAAREPLPDGFDG